MSLAPTQHLSREELEILNKALDCFYMSDEVLTDEQETAVIVLKEKISKVRFSDFDVCILETLK